MLEYLEHISQEHLHQAYLEQDLQDHRVYHFQGDILVLLELHLVLFLLGYQGWLETEAVEHQELVDH